MGAACSLTAPFLLWGGLAQIDWIALGRSLAKNILRVCGTLAAVAGSLGTRRYPSNGLTFRTPGLRDAIHAISR